MNVNSLCPSNKYVIQWTQLFIAKSADKTLLYNT